jgi:hypothetical protein
VQKYYDEQDKVYYYHILLMKYLSCRYKPNEKKKRTKKVGRVHDILEFEIVPLLKHQFESSVTDFYGYLIIK